MNPCCCISLQTGTKIIAILHMVFSILFVMLGVFASLIGGEEVISPSEINPRPEASPVAVAAIILVVGVLSIFLSYLLLSGANKCNYKRCMVWFTLYAFSLVLRILETVFLRTLIVTNILGILIGAYFLWVVWDFMEELKREVEVELHPNQTSQV